MSRISLTIDGKPVKAREGEKLLWAALDNGIYIPNLCALRESSEPYAGCRLCFVEIEGRDRPVTACTEPVADGMVVDTQGPRALRLARTSFELIMASHQTDCARCAKNGFCELQKIAAHLRLKIKGKRFRRIEPDLPIDSSSPVFTYNPNKCVLCGKCVWVCRERLGIGVLGFARRGFQRRLTTFGDRPIAETNCEGCADCVAVCPVGALVFKDGHGPTTSPAERKAGKGTNAEPASSR
jgi:formate dehydrogenase major subunit/NADH-quinone oxidoreductase subunit G